MKIVDLTRPLKGYTGNWVLLSKDYKRVLASAKTLKTLIKRGEKGKVRDGYVMKVAKDYSHYVGNA